MSEIVLDLAFDMRTGKATFLREHSTIKPNKDVIEEVLESYIRSQMGKGADLRPPVERDTYRITLRLDLSGDVFTTTHDCGNAGLCTGILMQVLRDGVDIPPEPTIWDKVVAEE